VFKAVHMLPYETPEMTLCVSIFIFYRHWRCAVSYFSGCFFLLQRSILLLVTCRYWFLRLKSVSGLVAKETRDFLL
jgi:hypothetical protein